MARYELTINGRSEAVDVPEDMPLLWILRDILGMTGTKYGCGVAQCRACTVHVDGAPVMSCQLRAADVAGKKVTTIEGISAKGLHVVQRVWVDEQVPQCGYCQTGQIMSAIALLETNKHPSDKEIDAAMFGNLCRCGTYCRIRGAIKKVSEEEKAQ